MLQIRMLSGEVMAVPVEEVSSVRDVKQRLHRLHGLPPRFRQRLLLQGASLDDATKPDPVAELIDVARSGSVQEVESMLQLPLDPNVAMLGTGERPLSRASRRGHVEVARLLLEAGAETDLVENHGRTALMMAAQHAHV
ncbi:XBAT32, partial [Symbiodinium natans]